MVFSVTVRVLYFLLFLYLCVLFCLDLCFKVRELEKIRSNGKSSFLLCVGGHVACEWSAKVSQVVSSAV